MKIYVKNTISPKINKKYYYNLFQKLKILYFIIIWWTIKLFFFCKYNNSVLGNYCLYIDSRNTFAYR